jgi:hypothetical protein
MEGRLLGIKLLDGLQYGVALTGVLVLATAPVSLLLSGDLVLVKFLLFVAGLLLMLVGGLKARPRQQHVLDEEEDWRPRLSRAMPDDGYSEDGFAGLVNRLPPGAWYVRGPRDRLSDGGRFLVAWLVAWAVSFVMEAVFAVGVPPELQ